MKTPDETICETSRTEQIRHIYVEKLCILALAADDHVGVSLWSTEKDCEKAKRTYSS